MSTDQRNLAAYLADDATFRQWGSGVAAQLAAIGLVQTADTGQINWTTVARPASGYAGYEIWRFNDALQATKPVFLKVEYGVGNTADRPSFKWTVSTGTNGAGTPTGQVGQSRTVAPSVSKSLGNVLSSYCSGAMNRLAFCTNLDNSSSAFAMMLLLERTKTSGGVDTGDGIVGYSGQGTSATFQVIPYVGSVPGITNNGALGLPGGGVTIVGTDVVLSPTIAFLGKAFYASWCAYRYADIGELTPFTMTHLGGSHVYMPLGDGSPSNVSQDGASGMAMAMLWE